MAIKNAFRDDHDELMRLVNVFRHLIGQPIPPTATELLHFRHEFSTKLIAHLTKEDWLLYPVLLKSTDAAVAAVAEAFIAEMGGLFEEYKLWSAKWPTDKSREEWGRFGAETAALLDALSRRVERENRELYPLVKGDRTQVASDVGADHDELL